MPGAHGSRFLMGNRWAPSVRSRFAPTDPKTIYVGSGEADMRSDIAQGNGMFKSADGGKTWAPSAFPIPSRSNASSSTQRRATRLRRCAWASLRAEPRTRRIRKPRRRHELDEDPRPESGHGRHRSGLRAGQSRGHLCRAVANAAPTVERIPALERTRLRLVTNPWTAATHWMQIKASWISGCTCRPHRHRNLQSGTQTGLHHRRRRCRAACTAPTMPARTGKRQPATRASGSAAGISARSTADPKNPDRVYAMNTIVLRWMTAARLSTR